MQYSKDFASPILFMNIMQSKDPVYTKVDHGEIQKSLVTGKLWRKNCVCSES